jgi:hypothetical protein
MIVIIQLEVPFLLLFLTAQNGVPRCLVLFTNERCDSLHLGI